MNVDGIETEVPSYCFDVVRDEVHFVQRLTLYCVITVLCSMTRSHQLQSLLRFTLIKARNSSSCELRSSALLG
jgi:hypothetical protein